MKKISKKLMTKISQTLNDNGFKPPFKIDDYIIQINAKSINPRIKLTVDFLNFCLKCKELETTDKNEITEFMKRIGDCYMSKEDENDSNLMLQKHHTYWALLKESEKLIDSICDKNTAFDNHICQYSEFEQIYGKNLPKITHDDTSDFYSYEHYLEVLKDKRKSTKR